MRSRVRVATLVAITAGLAALGGGVERAGATLPGTNGKIAFVRGGDTWVAAADGSNALDIMPGALSPAWSPNGRQIAFVRTGNIWIMNADGSRPRQLVTDNGGDSNPSWSPDGKQIAYVRSTDSRIVRTRSDEPQQTQVIDGTDGAIDGPAWSPDGKRIAFVRRYRPEGYGGALNSLNTVSASGGDLREMTMTAADDFLHGTYDPDWAPDGKSLLVSSVSWDSMGSVGSLVSWLADGTSSQLIWSPPGWYPGMGAAIARQPVWSPDATRVLFAYNSANQPDSVIASVRPDGSGYTVITTGTSPSWQRLH